MNELNGCLTVGGLIDGPIHEPADTPVVIEIESDNTDDTAPIPLKTP